MLDIRRVSAKSKPWAHLALNALFPPRCAICRTVVGEHAALCPACWPRLRFITDPLCEGCGHPFDYASQAGILCGECIQDQPPYTQARSVFCYDEYSRGLVLGLKYADRTHMVPALSRWLVRAGQAFFPMCDVIVPVPLHYRRLIMRRFNQSLLLARGVGKLSNIPVLADGLVRVRQFSTQSGLSRKQRQDNVRGAFQVKAYHRRQLSGKAVMLIDDVMTTQATVQACTRALLKAGASSVYVLTLARALHT